MLTRLGSNISSSAIETNAHNFAGNKFLVTGDHSHSVYRLYPTNDPVMKYQVVNAGVRGRTRTRTAAVQRCN